MTDIVGTAPHEQGIPHATVNPPQPNVSKHRELLLAVNDSALAVRNGWVAFIAMMAFFFVAVAGVTHRDLLLDSPVPLPIIQVKIELTRFFQFAPLILVLMHFSVLLQYAMMARKTRTLHALLLEEEMTTGGERTHPLRLELSSYFFVQAMAGPTRSMLLGGFLRTMSWLTLGLFPLILLLYFQTTYLPFHDNLVTGAHRGYLIADFLILLSIGIFTRFPERGFWSGLWYNLRYHSLNVILTLGVWMAAMFFSFCVATLPDGVLDRSMKQFGAMRVPKAMSGDELTDEEWIARGKRKAFWMTAMLFEGRVDKTRGKATSWFARNLVVTDQDLVKDKDYPADSIEVSVKLRGRDLRHARFDRTDLHSADLTGAKLHNAGMEETNLAKVKLEDAELYGAYLFKAKLQRANFRGAKMDKADLHMAILQRADLRKASLQKANLENAQLELADLREADLQGANLKGAQLREANLRKALLRGAELAKAQLQGADLRHARMQGAKLSEAHLQGADLREAEMQGVIMSNAQLQGANLSMAAMQGAVLWEAQLQGAVLFHTQLQGADMRRARLLGAVLQRSLLQGANLSNAQLQAAVLFDAQLQGADMRNAEIWRTTLPDTSALKLTDGRGIKFKTISSDPKIRKMLEIAVSKIPFSQRRDNARKRLMQLLSPSKDNVARAFMNETDWNTALVAPLSDHQYRKDLTVTLAKLACADETREAWVAQALIDRATKDFNGDTASLYDRLANTDDCISSRKEVIAPLLKNLKAAVEKSQKSPAQ